MVNVFEAFPVGPPGVEPMEGQVSVGVGDAEAVGLGQHDRLDNGEPDPGPIPQVEIGLRAVEPLGQLPASVVEVEEGAPVRPDQMPRTSAHLK
jgi:hypothetical protein